jgi:hypothetical protein
MSRKKNYTLEGVETLVNQIFPNSISHERRARLVSHLAAVIAPSRLSKENEIIGQLDDIRLTRKINLKSDSKPSAAILEALKSLDVMKHPNKENLELFLRFEENCILLYHMLIDYHNFSRIMDSKMKT